MPSSAAKLRQFVGEIIKRFCAQMMETFRAELARVIDRRPFVIDPFELRQPAWIAGGIHSPLTAREIADGDRDVAIVAIFDDRPGAAARFGPRGSRARTSRSPEAHGSGNFNFKLDPAVAENRVHALSGNAVQRKRHFHRRPASDRADAWSDRGEIAAQTSRPEIEPLPVSSSSARSAEDCPVRTSRRRKSRAANDPDNALRFPARSATAPANRAGRDAHYRKGPVARPKPSTAV